MPPAAPQRQPGSANLTGAEVFAMALRRHGVKTVFGQSIPTQIHLAAPAHGIAQIGYRTEHAGAIMADGYARIAGRVGVVTAQNGPAATLLVAGLAEALKASCRCLRWFRTWRSPPSIATRSRRSISSNFSAAAANGFGACTPPTVSMTTSTWR
jgi:hypothetical protein